LEINIAAAFITRHPSLTATLYKVRKWSLTCVGGFSEIKPQLRGNSRHHGCGNGVIATAEVSIRCHVTAA
jgi:hypothetical protein